MMLLCVAALGCGDDTSKDDADSGTTAGTGGSSAGTGGSSAGTGGSSAGTGGSSAGTGGSVANGDPIAADAMTWTYVGFPNTKCRDGMPTGLGINLNPDSDKVIIYLEGGGACFNTLTCAMNSDSWGEANLGTPGGVLSREGNNPFKDWNLVYIPYCTGDIYSGSSESGYMGQPQVGYLNMGEYLARLVPTFDSASEVVLSGSSAGGFGAAWNAMRTQDAFGDIPVRVLNDSGPPTGPMYTTACMQQRLAEMWGWAETVHPDCTDCDIEAGEVALPLTLTAVARTPAQRTAIISFSEDTTIKLFLGFGLNDCANFDGAPVPFEDGQYPAALAELRETVGDQSNFAMFEYAAEGHTFFNGDLSNVEQGGKTLLDWVTEFRDGDANWGHVLPE